MSMFRGDTLTDSMHSEMLRNKMIAEEERKLKQSPLSERDKLNVMIRVLKEGLRTASLNEKNFLAEQLKEWRDKLFQMDCNDADE